MKPIQADYQFIDSLGKKGWKCTETNDNIYEKV